MVKGRGETPPECQRGAEDLRRFEERLSRFQEAHAIRRPGEKGTEDGTDQDNIQGITRNLWSAQNSRKNAPERRQSKWEDRGEVYAGDGAPGVLQETLDKNNTGL